MPTVESNSPAAARTGPVPARARPGPALDLDVAVLDGEVRRVVDSADALKVLEGLARRQDDDPDLWHRLASARFDVGDRRGAVRALRRALELAPGDAAIEADLRAVGSHVVPDWHFAMLGDRERNRAYREAIDRVVQPGASVLELGAGSAMLSMFAARAGAERVTACEISGVLADTATEIVRANGLSETITVVDRHSLGVEVGCQLPDRADVLISELLDPALLAEGVLPSVRDARERLLGPDAVVLPSRAVIWAVLLEAPERAEAAPVRRIEGFDFSAMELLRDPDRTIVTRLAGEPVRHLTQPFAALDVDLSTPGPAGSQHMHESVVRATADGTVHGIGWWFELWLDETTTLTTGPEQSLHWPQVLQLLPQHRPVADGEPVTVTAGHDDDCILFSL